jgi:nicotinamide riboside kinase
MSKIGITGSMSVGKTSLVKELGKLPEFEGYLLATERSGYLKSLGIPLNTDSTFLGQTVFLAERASELLYDNLLTDRTIIDVMAFTRQSKSMRVVKKIIFEEYAKHIILEYDHIFYISTKGMNIEDNGVREINSIYRTLIDKTILNILKEYSVPHTLIDTTNMEDRISIVLNEITS